MGRLAAVIPQHLLGLGLLEVNVGLTFCPDRHGTCQTTHCRSSTTSKTHCALWPALLVYARLRHCLHRADKVAFQPQQCSQRGHKLSVRAAAEVRFAACLILSAQFPVIWTTLPSLVLLSRVTVCRVLPVLHQAKGRRERRALMLHLQAHLLSVLASS